MATENKQQPQRKQEKLSFPSASFVFLQRQGDRGGLDEQYITEVMSKLQLALVSQNIKSAGHVLKNLFIDGYTKDEDLVMRHFKQMIESFRYSDGIWLTTIDYVEVQLTNLNDVLLQTITHCKQECEMVLDSFSVTNILRCFDLAMMQAVQNELLCDYLKHYIEPLEAAVKDGNDDVYSRLLEKFLIENPIGFKAYIKLLFNDKQLNNERPIIGLCQTVSLLEYQRVLPKIHEIVGRIYSDTITVDSRHIFYHGIVKQIEALFQDSRTLCLYAQKIKPYELLGDLGEMDLGELQAELKNLPEKGSERELSQVVKKPALFYQAPEERKLTQLVLDVQQVVALKQSTHKILDYDAVLFQDRDVQSLFESLNVKIDALECDLQSCSSALFSSLKARRREKLDVLKSIRTVMLNKNANLTANFFSDIKKRYPHYKDSTFSISAVEQLVSQAEAMMDKLNSTSFEENRYKKLFGSMS